MNAKGLTVEQLIEYHKSCLPELYFMIQWNEPDEYPPKENLEHQAKFIEATISALSATIPRETAKCEPTEGDVDKYNRVLAYDSLSETWLRASIELILGDKTYTFWLPMPVAPEAIP